ncbi:MAG: esterase family protein [Planctomycetaceae bacterium]|nr:esterase family protein [Planctomycetaceae bacterium]MCB9939397.1 esterase family protein [Planctomycetaceae bacterium]HRX78248.1 alpha/beta hydrolase-fold protein [Pirellulaceae bacterium]
MPFSSRCLNALLLFSLIATVAIAQRPDKKGASKKQSSPDDQYVLGPDSLPQDGVPKGEVTKYAWNDSKIYPGTVRNYFVYVPKQYDASKPACVFVCQDRVMYEAPTVFDNLIHKGEMPVTIGIFIEPGDVPLKPGEAPRKRPDGRPAARKNRSVEYDTLSDVYSKFLLDEILPEVSKKYNLTTDPEGRCIGGSSSGGICAFTVCWERPDAFRKCFTTVGSFTNIRGGNAYPELVRKSDKKPIRIFQQDGANDIVNQFGSWPEANKAMAAVLQEKGYDHRFIFGEGVHSAKHGTAIFPDAMRWMWRDYPRD